MSNPSALPFDHKKGEVPRWNGSVERKMPEKTPEKISENGTILFVIGQGVIWLSIFLFALPSIVSLSFFPPVIRGVPTNNLQVFGTQFFAFSLMMLVGSALTMGGLRMTEHPESDPSKAEELVNYLLYSGVVMIVVGVALVAVVGYQRIPLKSPTFACKGMHLFAIFLAGGYFASR
ncbi:hypothetical protein AKJ41_04535 [candidate division MSBL1 archaeon SCGC-AAA259O05]|uniref:Uncharacterized protein n=1 Tax=candidate division MSBL1 archaeon SCGC-AAA259O05 TaxID=1698271 RepID=A0A133V0J6_9EURY|nr:hypothetical protein AKJ41_04535 [candidate division MSBL1 archaeon SCGC-AAA259O05]